MDGSIGQRKGTGTLVANNPVEEIGDHSLA